MVKIEKNPLKFGTQLEKSLKFEKKIQGLIVRINRIEGKTFEHEKMATIIVNFEIISGKVRKNSEK